MDSLFQYLPFLEEIYTAPMLHAASVHMPIALAVLGAPLALALLFLPRRHGLRALTVAAFALMAVSSFAAAQTGTAAREEVPNTLPTEAWETLDTHETLGLRVGWLGLSVAVLLAVGFVPQPVVRQAVSLFGFALSVVTFIVISITAHHGGELVYRWGVGTDPMREEAGEVVEAPATPDAEPVEATAAIEPAYGDDVMPIRPIDLEAARQISYVKDIVPIIDYHCIYCHMAPDIEGGYEMDTVANMMKAGNKEGPGIVPGKPDESSIILYSRGILKPQMPRGEDPIPEEDLHTLRQWIAAGAPDDSNGEVMY